MNDASTPLPPDRLRHRCDPAAFDFDTTGTLPAPARPFGQDRAVEALELALSVAGRGYNVFVLGEPGSHRHETVRGLLRARAATRPAPPDWCHVNNFEDPNKPRVLSLPAGLGDRLRTTMDRFADELGKVIVAALESDDYRSRIEAIEKEFKGREERALEALGDAAQAEGIALLRTPQGLALAPMKDDQPLPPEQFDQLPEAERDRIAGVVRGLRERLDKLSQDLPRERREMHAREREATRHAMALAVGHMIEELKEGFAGHDAVLAFLDAVQADVIETGAQMREQREDDESLVGLTGSLSVNRYRVNLLVPHPDGHAPVVSLDHPTYANLVGRIDHLAHMGTLLTNFMLVKAGALHEANGGYLMLDALKVLQQPYAWDGLKRALRAGEIRVESLSQLLGWIGTLPLEPEPVPLDVKVVLFGEREHYYLLQALDPEFDELFKVAADFEDEVPRDAAHLPGFAALVGGLARAQALRPLDRTAVAAMVEHASRMAGDARKLSTRTRELEDVMREADHEAALAARASVTADDVRRALSARIRRSDRIRDAMQEAVAREALLIDTTGEHLGQVNGLAVHELGDFAFGHPVRITATARVGDGGLVDIERESTLGQPIHSKGVMILASYLGARYAQGQPLSLSASLVFEQSYGPVEGDSASLAELCALLSTLSGLPLRQGLAVTGSVNQHGQVQAIGGVNEKIEGFFDVCRRRGRDGRDGLDGQQGVLVPAANVEHLMLREDVVAAAAEGRFRIHAVRHVDEAIELLTGVPAGAADSKGWLPEGTVNRLVAARLARMSEVRQAFGAVQVRDIVQAPSSQVRAPVPASVGRARAWARRRR